MAFSTQVITDLKTCFNAGPSAATSTNATNPSGVTATGGSGSFATGSGVYASGTFYGGLMDYLGCLDLCIKKCQEVAVLLARIMANTDSGDSNVANLIKCLNLFQ